MDVRVFGSLEVSVGGRQVPLGAVKPEALFAMLALNTGSVVSIERLIEGLWGEDPPPTARKLVHVYVSRLRRALAAVGYGSAIVTRGRGYEFAGRSRCRRRGALRAAGGARLAAGGARAVAGAAARRPRRRAVRSCGDPAVGGAAAGGARGCDRARLGGRRHRNVVAELDSLIAAEPLRERLHARRMLALYRCGRQADALDAYRHARAVLVDTIGVEPGPELRRLHEAILVQDPALEAPTSETIPPPAEAPGERPA